MEHPTALTLVLVILFALSEVLDAIPSVKANSIWKAIRNVIYSLKKPSSEDQPKA
jgi:hypothetical protein